MKLRSDISRVLESVYTLGMPVGELVELSGCKPYQAHMYVGRRLFEEMAQALSEGGLSTYQIAHILGSNQTEVSRTLRRLRLAAKAWNIAMRLHAN